MTVPDSASGKRLDVYLGEHVEIGSRSHAGKLIDAGAVTVDGLPAKKGSLVTGAQRVTVEIAGTQGDASQPAVPFTVIYEDADLLVIDKPAGLVVHPAPGNPTGTLSQALTGRAGGGDRSRPGIVHRLDKDTSGLLVVARSDTILRALQEDLRERRIAREYTALVRGRPESRAGTIDAPLGRDRRLPQQVSVRADSPRAAVTHFETIEDLPGHTLLRVRLETGRTHQIRVHLAAIELPVSGDTSYGVAGDLGLDRQFLHASKLSFTHPASGERLSISSELPPALAHALQRARGG